MCGRFALNENPRKFSEHFKLSGEVDFSPSWNIAPSSLICTITDDTEGHRQLHKMKWGLIPSGPTTQQLATSSLMPEARPLRRDPRSEQHSNTTAALSPLQVFMNGRLRTELSFRGISASNRVIRWLLPDCGRPRTRWKGKPSRVAALLRPTPTC